MKKTAIAFAFIALAISQTSYAQLQACGTAHFNQNMTCEKPGVNFDTTACDENGSSNAVATKISCKGNEMVALLKTKNGNYRAVFIQADDKTWSQKGKVWKSGSAANTAAPENKQDVEVGLKSKTSGATIVAPVISTPIDAAVNHPAQGDANIAQNTQEKATEAPAPTQEQKKEEKKEEPKKEEKPAATPEVAHAVTPEHTKAEEKSEEWKFKFGGFSIVENESLENFGEGTTDYFSSTDAYSKQNATNMLVDLNFSAKKDQSSINAIFEFGEIFFGDSSTGGAQGLRSKIVKVRNLYAQEEFASKWFLKAGLWTVSSDPHGFILNDHVSGISLFNETDKYFWQMWYAVAADNKIGASTATKDSYFGLSHTQKLENKDSWSLFAVYRGLRESFIDNNDLVTSYSGKSSYTWAGFNYTSKGAVNAEFNAIGVSAKFTGDNGGSDSNTGWLAHVRADKDFADGFNFAVDALGTSGADNSRTNAGAKVLTKRGNYATGAPNCAYLLTMATSDGADDAPGSARTGSNTIAKLDSDEGLQVAVATLSKSFGDKWSTFVRYGMLQSMVAKASTASKDMGTEIDLRVQYKISKPSDITIDYGNLKPGAYFTNKDTATLTTLRYKTEF